MLKFYNLRKFGRFILRLFKWIPILWKQEDWDFEYMYDLLEIKMKDIRECLKKDTLHVNSDRHVREISVCLGYMDRFRNWDNYIKKPDNLKSIGIEEIHSNIGEYRIKEYVRKNVAFEKDNYDMFWKCFIKWHRNWGG